MRSICMQYEPNINATTDADLAQIVECEPDLTIENKTVKVPKNSVFSCGFLAVNGLH